MEHIERKGFTVVEWGGLAFKIIGYLNKIRIRYVNYKNYIFFFFFSIKIKKSFQKGNNFFRKIGLQKIKKHTRAGKAFEVAMTVFLKTKNFINKSNK